MKSLLGKWNTKENILLATIWGAVIITGFLALRAIFFSDVNSLLVFGRIHSFAVRLAFVYTAVHVYRHREQIMLRFGIKTRKSKQVEKMGIVLQSPKNNPTIKIATALAFHIVLHIISIHLAVAYTLFHIVQHRHAIFSRKRNHNYSLPLAQVA